MEEASEALVVRFARIPRTGPSRKKTLSIEPARLIVASILFVSNASASPAWRSSAVFSSVAYGSSRSIRSSVASPAATATGFPLSVPAWYTGPVGASCSIRSRRPPNAAREPAAHHLAEDREVGDHVEALLGAAARDPEARDHLVEDQQRVVLVAEQRSPSR